MAVLLSAPVAVDPHRDFLVPRHEAVTTVNHDSSLTDGQADDLVGWAAAAENLVVRTPAATAEGAAIKMLVLLQMTAVGHEVSEEMAWPVVEEAAGLLGMPKLVDMGYLAPEDQRAREAAADAVRMEAQA
ncbi:hypothetical protein [Sphingomonas jatrophae]|uniref:Uncharacterized protein n=1 Tax=Sphingomonas jatrophae TaxID=1166337 RepID=A0A1I6M9H7_9SPHN|nr:hypothetical protein [Sphingomonas jatrophae]SFS12390.1 hypothetical protein SAMN05192580_3734 [Sphingomonas jatrophae]